MTGHELRLLRALRRGPIYAGALELMTGIPDRQARTCARRLKARGYVARDGETFRITEAGEEIVAAMTP